MNSVVLMGRLTRDVEARWNGDKCVARYTLAVDRKFKRDGEDLADFINCVSFGKTAEFLEKYGRKGTKFAVEGRIQTGKYTDKDGKTIYTTDVVVESVEFAESKSSQATPIPAPVDDEFMNIDDSDLGELPFN